MRLGLLGPAHGNVAALTEAARLALEDLAVDRAVYLGIDGAMDLVVQDWARKLVGENPTEEGLWARATQACLRGSPEAIDTFLRAEHERCALRLFESLPDAGTRSVEMLSGKLVVMIHDKACLDEEDMLPATLLLFGKSEAPVIRQIGQRWFLSPGPIGEGGVMTLEDREDGVIVSLLDPTGAELRHERLTTARSAKLRLRGAEEG